MHRFSFCFLPKLALGPLFLAILAVLLPFHGINANSSEIAPVSLIEALNLALSRNPELEVLRSKMKAEMARVYATSTPEDPMIGLQQNQEAGEIKKFWTASASLKFPLKYYFLGSAQSAKASALEAQYEDARLKLRADVISTYYALFAAQKTIERTQANIQALAEFSRIAERKYAAGTAPQQDSMRAHVEQTRLEVELRLLKQEQAILKAKLKELLYETASKDIRLSDHDLLPPTYSETEFESSSVDSSFVLQDAREQLEAKKDLNRLAKIDFIPDLKAKYSRQFSGTPGDNHMLSLEISVPLFFTKKGGEAFAAGYEADASAAKLASTKNQLQADLESLKVKVKTQSELLMIYETSLIPQASTTYNSTTKAYQANKSNFLDLLDSERSVWNVEISYYRVLTQYVQDLTALERVLGRELISFSGENKENIP